MSRGIPARHLHLQNAFGWEGGPCLGCGKRAVLLHHDHLMDYALRAVEHFAMSQAAAPASEIWRKHAAIFLSAVRFRPVHVCAHCNEGDGWAKCPNWYGNASKAYPSTFSMTLPELASMRASVKGIQRRDLAMAIWMTNRHDHHMRRQHVLRLAEQVVAGDLPRQGSSIGTGVLSVPVVGLNGSCCPFG